MPEWVINTWCPAKKELDLQVLSILEIQGIEWQEKVLRLTCFSLIFIGEPEQGGLVTPVVAAQVRDLNPRCMVLHVPGIGYHIRFEDYDTYMFQIRGFLQEIE